MPLAQMPDAGPWIGVIGACVMWTGFIVVLLMGKSFVTHAITFALVEFVLKTCDKSTRSYICRHFVNEDRLFSHIEDLRERMGEIDTVDKKSTRNT